MYLWFSHLGSSLGLFVTLLPSRNQPGGDDVVVDVPALVTQLDSIYPNHDYGPREY